MLFSLTWILVIDLKVQNEISDHISIDHLPIMQSVMWFFFRNKIYLTKEENPVILFIVYKGGININFLQLFEYQDKILRNIIAYL